MIFSASVNFDYSGGLTANELALSAFVLEVIAEAYWISPESVLIHFVIRLLLFTEEACLPFFVLGFSLLYSCESRLMSTAMLAYDSSSPLQIESKIVF